MRLTNGLKVYCKSMGKILRVAHIAQTDDEANEFCAKHPDTGVIALDQNNGLVFIAELYQIKIDSKVLPD
uniref:Uncharacterized protein n=1 Tax=viral metagenome TaxID=1070528 RepID=A0A6H1ZV51_9ZZZZ